MNEVEQIAAFKSWLLSKGYAPKTAADYVYWVSKTMDDPEAFLRNTRSRVVYKTTRAGWKLLSKYLNRQDIWDALRDIEGPRASPPRPKPIPSEAEWVDIARSIWERPGNTPAVAWIIMWSSLRISDVLRIHQRSVFEALQRGATTIKQKGIGGDADRLWVPGPLAMLGLQRLAGDLAAIVKANGDDVCLWNLCSSSKLGAEGQIRQLIPKPYSPHSFRRAFISYAVQMKMPLPTIQSITGHANLASLQVYINKHIAVPPSETETAQTELVRHIIDMAASKTKV